MPDDIRHRFLILVGALTVLLLFVLVYAFATHHLTLPKFHRQLAPPGFVHVVKVSDGDTIEVDLDGKTERVRLIGVDTPETVDPRRPVQCGGKAASDHTKSRLKDQDVRLQSDQGRGQTGDRDKYHRLLRYVFLADGTDYNEELIREGFGHEYTYQSQRYDYQAEFKAAEIEAKTAQRGLWSPQTCNGDTKKPA